MKEEESPKDVKFLTPEPQRNRKFFSNTLDNPNEAGGGRSAFHNESHVGAANSIHDKEMSSSQSNNSRLERIASPENIGVKVLEDTHPSIYSISNHQSLTRNKHLLPRAQKSKFSKSSPKQITEVDNNPVNLFSKKSPST